MSTYKVLNTGAGETVEQFVAGKQNYADPYTKTYTAEELQAQDNTTPNTIQTEQSNTTPQTDEETSTVQVNAKPKEPSIWDNGFDKGMEAQPDMSIYDAIRGYNAYAKENQKDPLDIFDIWPLMQGGDIMKSKAQNELDEKKRARKEKWDKVTNALLHLGNFVGTIAGSPSQDIESSLELTKRQQLLRDKTLEQRRQANNDFLKVYQAQKANEIAAAKEARAQQQQDRLDAELFLKQKQLEWKIKESEGKMDLQQQKLELEKAKMELQRQVQMGRLSQGAARIALSQLNYDLKAAGSTSVTTEDGNGKKTVVVTPNTGETPASPTNNGGGRNLGIGLSHGRHQRQYQKTSSGS